MHAASLRRTPLPSHGSVFERHQGCIHGTHCTHLVHARTPRGQEGVSGLACCRQTWTRILRQNYWIVQPVLRGGLHQAPFAVDRPEAERLEARLLQNTRQVMQKEGVQRQASKVNKVNFHSMMPFSKLLSRQCLSSFTTDRSTPFDSFDSFNLMSCHAMRCGV